MKRFCGFLSLALGLALNFLMPSTAMAQAPCRYTPVSAAGPLEVDVSAPLNSQIAQVDVEFSLSGVSCQTAASSTVRSAQAFYMQFVGPWVNVYRTNIPGIGVSSTITQNRPSNCGAGFSLPMQCGGTGITVLPRTLTITFRFLRIGTISATPQNLSGTFASWVHGSNTPTVDFLWGSGITISPRRPTCSIAAGDRTVNVPLGDIAASAFTGVGSTAGGANFNLAVTCTGGDAGALARTIDVRATDATNNANTSQVLSLTTASTARGVGVQLRRGATALTYGARTGLDSDANQWRAGSVGTGTSSLLIPLSARYVQTAAPVTAGSANAQAIFTFIFN